MCWFAFCEWVREYYNWSWLIACALRHRNLLRSERASEGCFSTQRTHKWTRSLQQQHNSGNNEWPNELLCYQRFDDAIINGANARQHRRTHNQNQKQLFHYTGGKYLPICSALLPLLPRGLRCRGALKCEAIDLVWHRNWRAALPVRRDEGTAQGSLLARRNSQLIKSNSNVPISWCVFQ